MLPIANAGTDYDFVKWPQIDIGSIAHPRDENCMLVLLDNLPQTLAYAACMSVGSGVSNQYICHIRNYIGKCGLTGGPRFLKLVA